MIVMDRLDDCLTPGELPLGSAQTENLCKQPPSAPGCRDAQIDNCKLLLIFFMVLGHTFEQFRSGSTVISVLFSWIYIFHMEAFVFFAGYYSKNVVKCRETAVERFLVPYILFNFLSYLSIALINGSKFSITGFKLFSPQSTMWFLFALFIWKILLPDLARVRFILPISILLGLGSGMFSSFGLHYAFTRIFSFLPFFIAGYKLQPAVLDCIRRLPRMIGCSALAVTFISCFLLFGVLELPPGMLYLSRNYQYYDIGLTGKTALWAAMGLRLLFYVLSAMMIAALLILMPRKEVFFTKLGRNTMTVYLLHFFFIRIFKRLIPTEMDLTLTLALCLGVSVVLTGVLSLPVVTRGYSGVMRRITRLICRRDKPAESPHSSC